MPALHSARDTGERRQRLAAHAAAFALLAATAWIADLCAAVEGPAFDEPLHLGAGLAYLSTGDFRLDMGSGVLPQMWAALPLWRGGGALDTDASEWSEGDVWRLGSALLYAGGRDPGAVLRPARRMVIALEVAQGALVYLWSLRLFGIGGAWVSLALYAVCPNLLAHGRLVTSDLPTAFAFCGAVGAAGIALARPGAWRIALGGLAAGLLLLCKSTSLLFVPMLALLAAWRALRGASPGAPRWLAPLASAAAVLAVAFAVVWAAHGVAPASESAPSVLDSIGIDAASGPFPELLRTAREAHLLPRTWLDGVGYAFATTRGRVSFAAGHLGMEGWWWYFPYCALVKTPLGTLGMLALAAAAGVRSALRRRRAGAPGRAFPGTAPLWILLGVYGVASVASNVNIGIRHLLPIFPPALILAGAAARWCDARAGRVAVPLLVCAAAAESAAVFPHHLSFFNRAAGGPEAGYLRLVDSNLDWGQDLPALGLWLAEQRARGDASPCYLSYFGSALPPRHGVDCARLPGFLEADPSERAQALGPGLYAISATMLQGVYLEPGLRGGWGEQQEARLAALEAELADPSLDSGLGRELLRVRERMRFVKLLTALRARPPDARVAYSILVYRVGPEELAAALAAAPRGA